MKLKFLCFLKAGKQANKNSPPCIANSQPTSLHCLKPHLLLVTQDHSTQLISFLVKNIQTMQSYRCIFLYNFPKFHRHEDSCSVEKTNGKCYFAIP